MGALLPRDKARVLFNYKLHLTSEHIALLESREQWAESPYSR